MSLNENADRICRALVERADQLRVSVSQVQGACVVDCGVKVPGSLEAGQLMAEVCLAGLAQVRLTSGDNNVWRGPWINVSTDHPVAACMASQYAGWQLSYQGYFAMGSGPMRAARGREPLFETIGCREQPPCVVGVLESGKLPTEEVCQDVAQQCNVSPDNLTFLVAPTASICGTYQVVARSVETSLHKMLELEFDLGHVIAGFGVAPLPPVAGDDMTGIGRTNDAVLYGTTVTLWVRGDDDSLRTVGPKIPSRSSSDFGRPFAEIFERYERDFYKIDPLLFSPAEVQLVNLDTGSLFCFGKPDGAVVQESFGAR